MADLRISELTELTSLDDTADQFAIVDNSISQTKRVTLARFDSRYLIVTNNLSDLADIPTSRANLGLVAGGAGDIWVEKGGDTMTGLLDVAGSAGVVANFGDGSNSTQIAIDGSAGQPRDILFRTAGVDRWIFRTDATAEGGSNAGSDFTLLARADDGSNIANAFFVRRSDQQFGMGVANPVAKLDVSQTDATAAVPVLKLNQLDVDEPFILCRSSAASADLSRSLVDAGDVSVFAVVGYLKIEVDDTGNQITDGDYYVEFGTLS